jgi:hypothetical protein
MLTNVGSWPQALLIEYNMADVDAAIDALNAALARGEDDHADVHYR